MDNDHVPYVAGDWFSGMTNRSNNHMPDALLRETDGPYPAAETVTHFNAGKQFGHDKVLGCWRLDCISYHSSLVRGRYPVFLSFFLLLW